MGRLVTKFTTIVHTAYNVAIGGEMGYHDDKMTRYERMSVMCLCGEWETISMSVCQGRSLTQ